MTQELPSIDLRTFLSLQVEIVFLYPLPIGTRFQMSDNLNLHPVFSSFDFQVKTEIFPPNPL